MGHLPLTFRLLAVCGGLQLFSTKCKRAIYYGYTAFVVLMISTFLLFEFIGVMAVDNVDDFSEYCYMLLTITVAFFKLMNIQIYRRNIVIFRKILMREPYHPTSIEEIKIQKRYDERIHWNTLQYAVMIETSVLSTILNSLLTDFKHRNLLYKAWLPFNISNTCSFYTAYFHQILAMTMSSVVHVATDTLLCGLLLQICCQLEILESRLKSITTYRADVIRKCIQHYTCIYQFAGIVNDTFKLTIFVQYFISTLVLCVSLYQLLKTNLLSMEFLALIMYLSTLLTQIFIYCWYANEVKLKSRQISDSIFAVNWTELSNDAKKLLLIVMKRAAVPIEFTSGYMVTINLESFVVLIKTSYSAYNILQQTQK